MPEPAGSPGEPSRNVVLITRPEPGAGETAARIVALGFTPVLCPMLEIRPVGIILPAASHIAAILATSGNALAALPTVYCNTPLFAVGNATAMRARRAGFTQVASADGDAVALAARVREELDPAIGPLLLVVGQGHGEPLAAALRQAGYRVLRRVVYHARPARVLSPDAVDAIKADRVRTALFFSAETARQFVRLVNAAGSAAALPASLQHVDAVAIGNPAAVALESLPWRRVRVAARPNQDEMLALL